jgi:glycosyltransferase involved in cell wall biosynthesis
VERGGPVVTRVFGWETSLAAEHHFRIGMPFPLLDPTRFETHRGQPGEDIFDYDVVFAHRLAGEAPLWQKLCADPNVLTVYDMDDDLLNVDPANTIPYRIFHPIRLQTLANVIAADVVTVSSPGLLEAYQNIHPRVVMLPICIPDEMPEWPIPPREGLTVGWAGSMHKRQDWPGIAWALHDYARRVPHARFRMYGADYTGGLLGGRCEFVPFTTDVYRFYRSLDFDIGIAPLIDTPFNRKKCHTKLIEYGARGIPTIASALGQNNDWIKHGINGFLINNPSEMAEYLVALTDAATRSAMASAAHATACEWTIGKHIHLWEEVFGGALP